MRLLSLCVPVLAILLSVRAVITYNALWQRGVTVPTVSVKEVQRNSFNSRGNTVGSESVYSFTYRGICYVGTIRLNPFYLGEWPHDPYRVTFLPENPEINDILPVNLRYVVCKSINAICLILLSAAFIWLIFSTYSKLATTKSKSSHPIRRRRLIVK